MSFKVEKEWITKAGFKAVVIMTEIGHRCGYVGVDKEHVLYGVEYDKPCSALVAPGSDEPVGKRGVIPLFALALSEDESHLLRPEIVFNVHGGITYTGNGNGRYPVVSDLWWFGYDCAHCDDARSPEAIEKERKKYPNNPPMWYEQGIHRTLEYCIQECENLADQFITRVHGSKNE